jgi:hypothetical protein
MVNLGFWLCKPRGEVTKDHPAQGRKAPAEDPIANMLGVSYTFPKI